MKKTYQIPTYLYLDLSDEDVLTASANVMSSRGDVSGADIDANRGTSFSSFFGSN